MVDRGGLNYPIRVRDEFSKTTQLFRKEIGASKKAFRDFQKVVQGQKSAASDIRAQAKAVRELAKAQQQLATSTKKVVKPLTDEEKQTRKTDIANKKLARSIAEVARQQKVRERTAVSLRSKQTADQKRDATRRGQIARAAETERKRQETATKKRIAALAAERKAGDRAVATRVRELAALKKIATARNIERQARLSNAKAARTEAVALKSVQLLKERAFRQFGRGDILGGTKTLRTAKALNKTLKSTNSAAGRLLFTFRRLVGTLALFTLARKGVQAFNQLVQSGLKFNDTIISSTLGVAGLIATLGDVRDGIGQSVGAAQELDFALGLARTQIELLRQDSLRTVATFSQLLDTFQVAVGPGLAAGLNLDEVRSLTVQISQAAAALSVPQNQLAEEIRSLLAGTIQARTTRIATALGITNADIRRLKETGKLFDFLDERLEGFAESAQRQARQTISGLQALLKGAFEALVGEAAKPLFDELISLGNDLLDNVLTITDEFGNLKPNPEAEEAFSRIFDALRDGVVQAREFAKELGFEGLDQVLSSVGAALQGILGAAKALAFTFKIISNAIIFIRDTLRLTSQQFGVLSGFVAQIGVSFLLLKKTLSIIGLNFTGLVSKARKLLTILGTIATNPLVLVSAGIILIVKQTELWFESITGVNLTLGDTVALVGVGLVSAFEDVLGVVQLLVQNLKLLKESPKKAASGFFRTFTELGLAVGSALTGSDTLQDALVQSLTDRTGVDRETGLIADETELERGIRETTNAILDRISVRRTEREEQVAGLLAAADQRKADKAERDAKIAGEKAFDPNAINTSDFTPIVSTADKSINALSADLLKLTDDLEKAQLEFAQGFTGGGLAGTFKNIFDESRVDSAIRLKAVEQDILQTRKQIQKIISEEINDTERLEAIGQAFLTPLEGRADALEALDLTQAEAQLVSLLRDQLDLRSGLVKAQELSNDLATSKAASEAQDALPAIREETALLVAQVAAEQAKTAAIVAGAGDRELALIAAQNALDLAKQELAVTKAKNLEELDSLLKSGSGVTDPKELAAINAVIDALVTRRDLEQDILALRIRQLEQAQKEADLAANGSLTDGLREGFQQFAQEFSSTFNAGIAIARAAVDGLARFASQAIVDAFDPTKEVDIVERFARLMQQIAQVILQQLIQLAIAKALIKKATGEGDGQDDSSVKGAIAVGATRVATESTIASIKIATAITIAAIKAASGGGGFSLGGPVESFAKGGKVPGGHFGRYAQGLTRGGRPAHIPLSDTVPAWLTPGEFVMNKAATSQFLPLLEGMNGGSMPVVGSGSAEAAGPTSGMARGGVVSQQVQSSSPSEGGPTTIVVPAIVATDREMDTLTAGGKNAMLSFMRENAGNINSLLDRSNRQG